MMTPEKCAAHITALATAFGIMLDIRVGMDPGNAGAGWLARDEHKPLEQRQLIVMLAPVIDETTYATALHELGHCLHPTGRVNCYEGSRDMREHNRPSTMDDYRRKLLEERSAWEWARLNALEWTDLMASVERMALATYERRARQLGVSY